MTISPLDRKNPPVYDKAIKMFDETIKKQGSFWCPICDCWFDQKDCATAVGHPFIDRQSGKLSIAIFGVCVACETRRAQGIDLAEAARTSISERAARRAASGEAEPQDSRLKFVIAREGGP